MSYFPRNLRRKSNHDIFVALRMDFFNETGPLSGLNVKQILLLARYSILLI